MTLYLTIFGVCLTAIGIYAFITGVGNLIHLNLLKKTKLMLDGDKVSVVIPARNEEANLPLLLDSFTKQTYRNFEVVVIDDASTDKTWSIIEEFMAKDDRIHGYKTDPNVRLAKSGKINALLQAIEHATGDYLYCTDADTIHNPEAIAFGYSIMKSRNLDIISGFPTEKCKSYMGSISMSSMLISFIFIPHYLARLRNFSLFTIAIGQFIMMNRKSYDEIGGYTKIGAETCDDMAISKHFVKNGKRFMFIPASDHCTCNMYSARKDAFYGIARSIGGLITTDWYIVLLVFVILFFLFHMVISPLVLLFIPLWHTHLTQMILILVGSFLLWITWTMSAMEMRIPGQVAIAFSPAILQICRMYLYGLGLKLKGKKFIWKGRPVD